jgi:hypothetical protein
MVVAGLALGLTSCGGAAPTAPPTASPTPSRAHIALRKLATGERVALACGLSLSVPAGYHGYHVTGAPKDSGDSDVVYSDRPVRTSVMSSFCARSLTSTAWAPANPSAWRLAASSADGRVAVHVFIVRQGTASAVSVIDIIVSLPGRPKGDVSFLVHGREASASSRAVLGQAASLWRHFAVTGASLPSPTEQ